MSNGAKLIRVKEAKNTDAILCLAGKNSSFEGGFIETENSHPTGIVQLGHPSTTGVTFSSERWRFSNCHLKGVKSSGNIAIYIPSGQVSRGDIANYFGTVENISVVEVDIGVLITELSNAHTFINLVFDNIISSSYVFRGAYGCSIFGGFVNRGGSGFIGVKLLDRTVGSNHHSTRNSIYGFGVEPNSLGMAAKSILVEANCTDNDINIMDNTSGDPDIRNPNNIINVRKVVSFPRVQITTNRSSTGTVSENAEVSAYKVSMLATRYGALIEVKVACHNPQGAPCGGGYAIFSLRREDGGPVVTEVNRVNSPFGVSIMPCTISGNDVFIRIKGVNNGTGTTYHYFSEASILVDNAAAVDFRPLS